MPAIITLRLPGWLFSEPDSTVTHCVQTTSCWWWILLS